MTSRVTILSFALFAVASVSQAQIGKTQTDAARKAAAATNAQTKAAEEVGQDTKKAAAPQTKAPAPQTKAPAPQTKAAPPAQTKAAPPPQQKGVPVVQQKTTTTTTKSTTQQKAGSRPDTSTGAVSQAGGRRNQVAIYRESFTYSEGGRRDPFLSLMLSGELRPVFTDLTLTGVVHDSDPRKSIAMLIDVSTGESYRVRVGQPLGRMRVQRIGLENITFSIDEFGLSRTETLVIDRSKKAGPAPARRP
jgi:hypothetical protein